ncbi:MAG: hypothetical protein IKL65_00070 [Bacilli bacterium]|nr:hypothetical protein [Bacilli bacterium]
MKIIVDGKTIEEIIKENKEHTLTDLQQKLINYLFNRNDYDEIDIEIMKILFK